MIITVIESNLEREREREMAVVTVKLKPPQKNLSHLIAITFWGFTNLT